MRRSKTQRIYALGVYLDHRDKQQVELKDIEDWQVRVLLWMRRVVQRTVFAFWVWELKERILLGLP